jgi:hypothetical protein
MKNERLLKQLTDYNGMAIDARVELTEELYSHHP